ncbi:MAG TPA: tetratricopeptide repeat protein [Kofleriaceae bacterium]|nr:tetratricopeptide repeat protein [Kofleriaceae bacterium]
MSATSPAITRCLAVLLALAAGAAPAAAQKKKGGGGKAPLERARSEIGELRYEDARKTVEKAIRSGTNGPEDMTELYLLLGEVEASLGEDDAAEDAFKNALVIDPSAQLREGLSPKIKEPFGRARKAMKSKKPLAIQHRILKADPPTIAVLVQSDPFGMIIGGRLIYKNADGAERSVAGMGKERVDLKLPPGTGAFLVAGIDEHGNRLIVLGSESEPLTLDVESGGGGAAAGSEAGGSGEDGSGDGEGGGGEEPATTVATSSGGESSGPPFYAHWMVWGSVAVGLAGVGVATGLATRSTVKELDDVRQNSEMYEFSYAQSLADKAERRALYTNIAFGAAAACAVVSGVLFFRQRGRRARAEREAALVPVVGAAQAGVAAHLRF